MSLAWRILLFALLLNVLTVGSVQIVVHQAQQQWFQNERRVLKNSVQESFAELERVYSAEALDDAAINDAVVRRLLRNQNLRDLYDDVIVTSGRPPYHHVYLNTLGAVHRDPDTFNIDEIQAGMERASMVDGSIRVGEGYCRALRQMDGVVGYLWFVPKFQPGLPTALPTWTALLGILASTLLFGSVLFWLTRGAIGRPMQQIGEAAQAVARGEYDARLPEQRNVPELQQLVATFNRMTEQVETHTGTLEKAVREAVEATEQKERALVQSSRLATIGTLAAGVAHEINNPIGGMQNAILRLQAAEGLTDRQQVYLQLVHDGLARVARTTRRMLEFAPKDAQSAPFDVKSAISGAYELIEHRCRQQNVSFAMHAADDLPLVYGDAHEIQQVMLNLFLNSLDAIEEVAGGVGSGSSSGGSLVVTCAPCAGVNGEAMVRVEVADDGPGMPKELQARCFDPFFTKKDRPDASGLGMFISYSIVVNHGGTMVVESSPGEGFTTIMQLPTAPA